MIRSAALLCALALLGALAACSVDKPVQPVKPPYVNPAAAAAAKTALRGAAAMRYAFFHADDTLRDSSGFHFHYTRLFLDSLRLADFISGQLQNQPLSQCYFPYATAYGTRYPQYWSAIDTLDYSGYNILIVMDGIDSMQTVVTDAYPEIYQRLRNAKGAGVTYCGAFDATGVHTPQHFQAYWFIAKVYGDDNIYYTQNYELKALSSLGQALADTAYPDSGSLYKMDTLLPGGLALLLPQFSGSAYNPVRRYKEKFWFHLNGAIVDSTISAYYWPDDSMVAVKARGARRMVSGGMTWLSGSYPAPADSVFNDTLWECDSLRVNGGRLAADSVSRFTVHRPSGDTVCALAPGATAQQLSLRLYAAGQFSDSLTVSRNAGYFTWADSSEPAYIVSDTLVYFRNAVYVNLARRERATGALTFSGGFYLDIYTGKGHGFVWDAEQGFRNALSLDGYGTSYLENLPLQ